MQTLRALAFLSLVAAAACGSSSGGDQVTQATDPSSPAACTTAEDCNPQECVCTDGQTLTSGTVCSAGSCTGGFSESSCASACKSNGGVSLIRPARNVATSAECDAWCSKGASLGCGSTKCNRFFFCGVSQGSCEAATRAALKCAVDEATWACSTHSTSWSVTSSCGTFASLCDVASAPSR